MIFSSLPLPLRQSAYASRRPLYFARSDAARDLCGSPSPPAICSGAGLTGFSEFGTVSAPIPPPVGGATRTGAHPGVVLVWHRGTASPRGPQSAARRPTSREPSSEGCHALLPIAFYVVRCILSRWPQGFGPPFPGRGYFPVPASRFPLQGNDLRFHFRLKILGVLPLGAVELSDYFARFRFGGAVAIMA